MLFDNLIRFLKVENLGINQAVRNNVFLNFNRDIRNLSKKEILKSLKSDEFPAEAKIIEIISNELKIRPQRVLVSDTYLKLGEADLNEVNDLKIIMGERSFKSEVSFIGTYFHELGHIKNAKLHKKLNFKNCDHLYNLAFMTTTMLYTIGVISNIVVANTCALSLANSLWPFLVPPMLLKASLIRTREYGADLFCYNNTGILPTGFLVEEKRKGLIGNISKLTFELYQSALEGYPLEAERDIICKIFGNYKTTSKNYTEMLRVERNNYIQTVSTSTISR